MNKPQPHQLTAWLIWLLILGVYATLVIRFPFAYVWATYEDLYGEWVQWYLFVAVMLLSGWLALRPSPYRWFFGVLALAGLYTAGEEISWGQRLLGIQSPEIFEEYNIQGETNLHNFLTGPEHTWTNDLMQITVASALLGFGVLYPLLLRREWAPALWVRRLGVPPPPLYLWPFFPVAALFEMGLFKFNEQEIAEILVGTAMMLMVAHHGLAYALSQGEIAAPLAADGSRRLAWRHVLLATGVVACAFATAQLVYQDPVQRTAIDQRVLNGYEKFAGRYETKGRWQRACELFRSSYEPQPDRLDLLGNLVTCLQTTEDPRYRQYARLLLERSLTQAQRESRNVMQQLSVSGSYRDIGELAIAQQHLQLALQAAINEARSAPEDPHAAYQLGMVHEVMTDYEKAREHYARARALSPGNVQFDSAYERVAAYLKPAAAAPPQASP